VNIFILGMKRLTVSLDERDVYRLKARVRTGEASSRSDALRQILDEYEDLHTECEDLHTENEELHNECERLRNRRDELRRQLQERGTVEETTEALVERTERHEDVLTEFVEAEQEKRQAGVVTRAKWWLLGRDGEENGTSNDEDAVTTDDATVEEDGVAASRTGN